MGVTQGTGLNKYHGRNEAQEAVTSFVAESSVVESAVDEAGVFEASAASACVVAAVVVDAVQASVVDDDPEAVVVGV